MTDRQLNLFDGYLGKQNTEPESNYQLLSKNLDLENASITFYPHAFDEKESDYFVQDLTNNIEWEQKYITLYGHTRPLPRLTAWYGDPGKIYTYSKIRMNPKPWTGTLLSIKKRIESIADVEFNNPSCGL
jgi:alkylated DNA repair dioxygenase AlkB